MVHLVRDPMKVLRSMLRIEDACPELVADTVGWATGERPDPDRVARVLRELGTTTNAPAHWAPTGADVSLPQVAAGPHGGEFLTRAHRLGY